MTGALSIKTDETLLHALQEAAKSKPTASELHEQRVSFVYGSVDSDSHVTKERIREVIAQQEGVAG